jgi:hypothetical protein
MKKKVFIILGIVLCLFCLWFFYLRVERKDRLEKEGNQIVKKIEEYKKIYGKLPDSLDKIGINTMIGIDALDYYIYEDSVNYTISFIMSIDNSRIYYSDTGKWEDLYRKMKSDVPD